MHHALPDPRKEKLQALDNYCCNAHSSPQAKKGQRLERKSIARMGRTFRLWAVGLMNKGAAPQKAGHSPIITLSTSSEDQHIEMAMTAPLPLW